MRQSVKKTVKRERVKNEILDKYFDSYVEHGLGNIGARGVAEESGFSSARLYSYFDSLDDLVLQATERGITKAEDEFLSLAQEGMNDLERFIDEAPYWLAKNHGKKYRFMYQLYANPQYIKSGKKFFESVAKRHAEFADGLAEKIGYPSELIRSVVFTFVGVCVSYALFENEENLKMQLQFIKQTASLFREKNWAHNE